MMSGFLSGLSGLLQHAGNLGGGAPLLSHQGLSNMRRGIGNMHTDIDLMRGRGPISHGSDVPFVRGGRMQPKSEPVLAPNLFGTGG